MKGIWLENQKLSIREDLENPRGEVIVRVLMAGICNTDLELVRGYYPYTGIPGHEFVGIVEQGPAPLQGKRVVGEINASCGTCSFCLRGMKNHCPHRTVLGIVNHHGAFAPYLVLPAENLHILPDSITDAQATFVEPLAAALEVPQLIPFTGKEKALIVGEGKLGQLVAQVLALETEDLLVLGRHREKLAYLEQRGIKTALETRERGFDLAVECTGNPGGFKRAREALRPRGTLALKSTYAGELTLDISSIVVDEISLVGTRCGPFDQAIKLLEEKKVDVDYLIEEVYPLSRGLAAFEHAGKKGRLKILLNMEGEG